MTKQFDQLLAHDLPALNDSLKSKGQQPLSTPPAKVGTNNSKDPAIGATAASAALPPDFRIPQLAIEKRCAVVVARDHR